MSIVRVGMAEDSKFGEGYDAIFNKKKGSAKKTESKKPEPKKPAAKAKATRKPANKK